MSVHVIGFSGGLIVNPKGSRVCTDSFTTSSISARPLQLQKAPPTMALKQNIRQAEGILRSVPDPGQIVCDPSVIPVRSTPC